LRQCNYLGRKRRSRESFRARSAGRRSRQGLISSQRHKVHGFSAMSLSNYLDKSRKALYEIPIGRIFFAAGKTGGKDEKLWLFETLAHNLSREPRWRSDFFIFLTRNSLKRHDSEQKMKENESEFTGG
jgi:hypothetical protein